MENEEIKIFEKNWIEEHKEEIFALSDDMWEHPELGLEEYRAASEIIRILKKYGFCVETNIGGLPTAFIATAGDGEITAGFNIEYDCLPGLSQKKGAEVPDPVVAGAPGQGCGHNILGPAALLAGLAFNAAREKFRLPVTIQMFGSPYEESSVGKPVVGKTGAYKNVDFFLDWHPLYQNRADYDKCNSVFITEYHFHGQTCHGAYPWQGRSALDAGMLFGHAIEILREHIIPGDSESPHTINYTFSDTGPSFANIVPDTTSIVLYGRFNEMETARDVHRRIGLCAKGAAMATETTVEEKLITFTHTKIPNKTLASVMHRNLEETGSPWYSEEEQNYVKKMQHAAGLPEDGLDETIQPFGYCQSIITDSSEFTWNAPYATLELSMGPKGSWHNWMVTACAGSSIGRKCLIQASRILSATAVDIVENPKIIEEAKRELHERLAGQTYCSLLPEDYTPPIGFNSGIMDRYFPDRQKSLEI